MLARARVLVLYYAFYAMLALLFGVFKVLQRLCFMEKPINKLMRVISTIEMRKEEYWNNLFSWEMLKINADIILLELQREARPGQPSPNPPLLSLDGSQHYHLLDFARGSRPLVVNIGSNTCPVFMKRLSEFNQIVEEFRGVADFVTIYIKEAHASDEWKLEGNIEIAQPRTQQERCSAAKRLRDLNKLHPRSQLLVDTMENCANKAFGGLPIRLYIIQDGQVRYGSGVGPTFYRTQDVKKWLSVYRTTSSRQRA